MSHIAGKVGAIYSSAAYTKSTGIAFDKTSDPDEITDSNSGFTVANGFADSMEITIYGSTSNDGNYTIVTRADGTLILGNDVLVQDEVAGDTVYVYTAAPGTELLGFFNWTLDDGVMELDVTDYADAGIGNYIPGIRAWTATTTKHIETDSALETLLGTIIWVRFFERYDASPDVTNAYYHEGPAILLSMSTASVVDGLVDQTITFRGVGPLLKKTQSVAW